MASLLGPHQGNPATAVWSSLLPRGTARAGARALESLAPLRELLRFAVSEDYFLLREKVGTAIAKAAAA